MKLHFYGQNCLRLNFYTCYRELLSPSLCTSRMTDTNRTSYEYEVNGMLIYRSEKMTMTCAINENKALNACDSRNNWRYYIYVRGCKRCRVATVPTCYWISVIIHKTIFASAYIQYDPVECGGFRINTQASTPPNSSCTSKRDNWNNNNQWVASSTTAVSHHGNKSPLAPNNTHSDVQPLPRLPSHSTPAQLQRPSVPLCNPWGHVHRVPAQATVGTTDPVKGRTIQRQLKARKVEQQSQMPPLIKCRGEIACKRFNNWHILKVHNASYN